MFFLYLFLYRWWLINWEKGLHVNRRYLHLCRNSSSLFQSLAVCLTSNPPPPPPPIPRLLTVNRYAFLLTTPAVLLYWLAYFLVLRFETNHADDTEANIQAEHVKPSVHDDAEPLLSNTHPTGKQKHFLFSFLFSFFFFSMCHILRYSDWNLESANVLTAKQLILIMKSVFLVQCHCMKRHTRIAFLQRNGTQQQIKLMQRNREKGY